MEQKMDSNNLHVITENGEQCFMWSSNQLTYIANNKQELPLVLATKFGPVATKLDLSYNTLTSFKNINMFVNLNELILDNNHLVDDQLDFKQNLRLKILSLNKNKVCKKKNNKSISNQRKQLAAFIRKNLTSRTKHLTPEFSLFFPII